jgi:hypothetical protein
MVLAKELAFYEANRAKLVNDADGQFVLVQGARVVALFSTENEALSRGYSLFGDAPFLVRRVAARDEVLNFSSMNVAL